MNSIDSDDDDVDYVPQGGEESNSDSDSDQEKQPSGKINSTAKKSKRKRAKEGSSSEDEEVDGDRAPNARRTRYGASAPVESSTSTSTSSIGTFNRDRAAALFASFKQGGSTRPQASSPAVPASVASSERQAPTAASDTLKQAKAIASSASTATAPQPPPPVPPQGFTSRVSELLNARATEAADAGSSSSSSSSLRTPDTGTAPAPAAAASSSSTEPAADSTQVPKAGESTESKRVQKSSSGLSSVLDMLGKKKGPNTLDKSKADWDRFVAAEGIREDLATHNRGRDGYLERRAFLERTDYREFERERDIRLGSMNKRFNSSLGGQP